jgi:predicted molibdopterin-dependent oxidoreductase YjgC
VRYNVARMRASNRYARLTQPHIRANGALRPATWDEALDEAARRIREATGRLGPDTFGLFSCSKATNEVNYMAQKLARSVIGSNNIDSCNRT